MASVEKKQMGCLTISLFVFAGSLLLSSFGFMLVKFMDTKTAKFVSPAHGLLLLGGIGLFVSSITMVAAIVYNIHKYFSNKIKIRKLEEEFKDKEIQLKSAPDMFKTVIAVRALEEIFPGVYTYDITEKDIDDQIDNIRKFTQYPMITKNDIMEFINIDNPDSKYLVNSLNDRIKKKKK